MIDNSSRRHHLPSIACNQNIVFDPFCMMNSGRGKLRPLCHSQRRIKFLSKTPRISDLSKHSQVAMQTPFQLRQAPCTKRKLFESVEFSNPFLNKSKKREEELPSISSFLFTEEEPHEISFGLAKSASNIFE